MKEKIFTLNGLAVDAILLENCFNMRKIFYCQGRLCLTDEENYELKSVDILTIMRDLQKPDIRISEEA